MKTDMTADLFSVQDKVCIITGGLGMLGGGFGRALAERGARVVLLDMREVQNLVKERYGALAERIVSIAGDVTKKDSLEAALVRIRALYGEPEVLVNNAALDAPPSAPISENGPFESYPEASFDKVMEVNVKGVMLCCQVFGAAMAKVGKGSIVNISSIYGMVSPDQRIYEYRRKGGEDFFKPITYAVSKSSLFNMTRYLSTYWGAQNVRVNTLTFGGVFNGQDQEFLKGYCAHVPLGRMARNDEYNGAIVFLASDASSYMTGSNMILDGGWTAW
jgi:NAD(P)-dependent dehydrogenase (short-subunit alcohol dehydrogenase family)